MNKLGSSRFFPLLVALGVVVGIIIGSFYANHFAGRRLNIINNSSNKINDLLHLIDDQYVDKVNINDLVEKSLPEILKQLDPHSTYISAADVEASMQELKGSFSGIGVSFSVFNDSIHIISVIQGGPSERAGLQAGDRIVFINNKKYVGSNLSKEDIPKLLKGPKGTRVKVGVVRPGRNGMINISIVRGDVPVKSIDAVYMADKTTGYIRINSFGDTTYPEFLAALAKLNSENFKGLIIDLRGNLGGYMEPAIQIAKEFLPKNRLIVYTEGRRSPRENFSSDGRGSYQNLPLVVLVDETSASASEIFAGAMQDNDRATIIGRRTFGKGLVQVPIQFRDGSMLRLTKARYYTPSGRCVQKPYKPGDEEDYDKDLLLRAEHGEFFSRDSIKTNGKKYHTRIGRVVYGGGGIIPDIFVPRDTTGMTAYFKEAYFNGLIYQFSCIWVDRNRNSLKQFNTLPLLTRHLYKEKIVSQFANYAATKGLKRRNLMIKKSHSLFESYINGYIIDNVLGTSPAVEYANWFDPAMKDALYLMRNGKAFPQLPSKKGNSIKQNGHRR